jgi:predicted transposase YbfD/YdcC
MEKGHGRIEQRTIDVALGLEGHRPVKDFIDWPYVRQVFRITRSVRKGGKTTTETGYIITNMTASKLPLSKAAELARGHWSIENRLHYVRDVTFDEDRSQVRTRSAPQAMAACRNIVIALLRVTGAKNIAAALRKNAAKPRQVATLIRCHIK